METDVKSNAPPPPTYKPPKEPQPGRFVTYHEAADKKDWPALILEVKYNPTPEGGYFSCHLQVFRAGGNHWKWAVEGVADGTWSWPIPHR